MRPGGGARAWKAPPGRRGPRARGQVIHTAPMWMNVLFGRYGAGDRLPDDPIVLLDRPDQYQVLRCARRTGAFSEAYEDARLRGDASRAERPALHL